MNRCDHGNLKGTHCCHCYMGPKIFKLQSHIGTLNERIAELEWLNKQEPHRLTEREKFLMREAMNAAPYYNNLDMWLSESIDDAGHVVEYHLAHDAFRLYARPSSSTKGG